MVPHVARSELRPCHPLHVTLRLATGLGRLRSQRGYRVVDHALRAVLGDERLRVVHLSVQNNHLHLIAESLGKLELRRALQGFAVRLARGYNRAFGRRGRVFADRYFARALKTPEAIRNALRYVLLNEAHHHAERRRHRALLAHLLVTSDGRWRRVPRDRSLPPSAYRPRGARLVGDEGEVAREPTPVGLWLFAQGADTGARAGPTQGGLPPVEADHRWWSDPFSTAALFDGWQVAPVPQSHAWCEAAAPVVPARTWLLRHGWRKAPMRR